MKRFLFLLLVLFFLAPFPAPGASAYTFGKGQPNRAAFEHALGLTNDHWDDKTSILYQGWTTTQSPSSLDWQMLNFLYSPCPIRGINGKRWNGHSGMPVHDQITASFNLFYRKICRSRVFFYRKSCFFV